MLNLKDQNILILGLGESGLSMARWCVFCGANVWVVDDRETPPHLATLKAEMPQVQFIRGGFEAGVLNAVPVKAVFKSPGLSPTVVKDLWTHAQSLGLSVGTELTLFALAMNELKLKSLYAPNVLAVTGTNGKTTVTSLTAALLRRAHMTVAVAGNIGPALLDTLRTCLKPEMLEQLRAFDLAALEAQIAPSSAQAQALVAHEDIHEVSQKQLHEATGPELGEIGSENGDTDTDIGADGDDVPKALTQDKDEVPLEPLEEQGAVSDVTSLQARQSMTEPAPSALALASASGSATEVVIPFEQLRAQQLLERFPWLPDLPQTWVLELSSFQLQGVSEFEATAATILNISQDHLDWHSDMEDYIQAKAAIFGEKTQRILNREDPRVMAFVPAAKEKVKQALGAKTKSKASAAPIWVEFGYEMPVRAGDFGVEQVNGMAWLVRALPESGLKIKKNQALEELEIQRLMPVDALRIFGRHNASNALAALALASTTQAKLAPMLYALREYTGEPHRIQSVQIIEGVEYIDDSKGTNVGATVAALEGLGHDRKLVLILGGEAKGQDFSPLVQPINRFARAVILIGKDAQQIQEALSTVNVSIVRAQTMQDAVVQASRAAKSADAVILSPACSSFDMFNNYAHRAQVFVQAVQELSEMGAMQSNDDAMDLNSVAGPGPEVQA